MELVSSSVVEEISQWWVLGLGDEQVGKFWFHLAKLEHLGKQQILQIDIASRFLFWIV